jgi:Zn finger protein HypA/HybF involved in hydrogenase expression
MITEQANDAETKVTLQCNECGKKRKLSPDGNYNDRCPKCGGVDWDVL